LFGRGMVRTRPFRYNHSFVDGIALSSDGETVAAGRGNAVELWSFRSGEFRGAFSPRPAFYVLPSLAPDGRRLAVRYAGYETRSGDSVGGLAVWDVRTRHLDWAVQPRPDYLCKAATF